MRNIQLKDQSWLMAIGRDSVVFPFPGDEKSLLKVYHDLSVHEIEEYHQIHSKYGSRWEVQILPDKKYRESAKNKWWKITFLEKEVQGIIVKVLDLSSSKVMQSKEWYTLAKIPFVPWIHLGNYFNSAVNEEIQHTLHVLEHMTHSGLRVLWVPVERKKKGWKILEEWHTIGRDNLMISWIDDNGIVEIIATDLWFEIMDSIHIERNLNWQSTQSR
jgi:hypothetical protein